MCRRNVGNCFSQKLTKTCIHLFGFQRLRDIMANIFWMKRDIDNRAKVLQSTKGFLHRLKISWTLVHKRVKIESQFSPTLRIFFILLLCQALHTAKGNPNFAKREEVDVNGVDASRIRSRRIVNVNETVRSLVSWGSHNHFKLAMASRRVAFSSNTSSIVTFSSSKVCHSHEISMLQHGLQCLLYVHS